jgi:Holliday junction resolvase RusA-like endonuclease
MATNQSVLLEMPLRGSLGVIPEGAIRVSVPAIPVNVNNYVKHAVIGGFLRSYKTKEAKAFEEVIAWSCKSALGGRPGLSADGRKTAYEVSMTVYLGEGDRGDVDNYAKQVLDGLAKGGVIESDARVVNLHCYKRRDRMNPRTEIAVWVVSL